MLTYDIYGVGNALVDHAVSVSDSDLAELGFQKGRMTLIEWEDMRRNLAYFGDRVHERLGGGSAANTMLGATQLDARCFYATKLGSDASGDFFVQDFLENGVDLSVSQASSVEDRVTGHCLVMVTEDGERTMATYLSPRTTFSEKDVAKDALLQSRLLYIEGYLVSSDISRQVAIKTRKLAESADLKIALTLSDPNMVRFFKDGLLEMMGDRLDLLFGNAEEVMMLTGSKTVAEACDDLRSYAQISVVTMGAEGAMIVSEDGVIQVPGRQVTVVDTNGAGDAFSGAFLAAFLKGRSLEESGRWGVNASSEVVSQWGARLKKSNVQKVRDLCFGS